MTDRAPSGWDALVEGAERLVEATAPPLAGSRIAAIGWATIDWERAAGELAALLPEGEAPARVPRPREPHLGASVVLLHRAAARADEPRIALLEPDTEGRLAAILARHGEGIGAVYVRPDLGPVEATSRLEAVGSWLGPPTDGPFGPQRFVAGQATDEPSVVVLD